MAILRSDLELAYFRWDGDFYAQRRGLAMGKSTSSPLSDIFMEDFEAKALSQYETGDPAISPQDVVLFWFRKADDTITAIRNDHIDPFFTFLNSLDPSIQWTMEREKDGCLPMLDVLVERKGNGSLEFDVYRKPTHTNQYIDFASHQPLSHKHSTIHSLTRRAALIPSTQEKKKAEEKRVKEALAINGYPSWAYERARFRPPPPAAPPPPVRTPTEPPKAPPFPEESPLSGRTVDPKDPLLGRGARGAGGRGK